MYHIMFALFMYSLFIMRSKNESPGRVVVCIRWGMGHSAPLSCVSFCNNLNEPGAWSHHQNGEMFFNPLLADSRTRPGLLSFSAPSACTQSLRLGWMRWGLSQSDTLFPSQGLLCFWGDFLDKGTPGFRRGGGIVFDDWRERERDRICSFSLCSGYMTCRRCRVILHETSFPEFEESFAGDRAALCTSHLKTRLKLPPARHRNRRGSCKMKIGCCGGSRGVQCVWCNSVHIQTLVHQGNERTGAPSVGLFISTSKERLCTVSWRRDL